jgi:predicted O-linked N-acetylglucosamine transferase (SPINDLY family)
VFQRSLKINAEDVGVWRQILARVPESRLIMKGLYCPSLLAQIRDWFGPQIDQVEFRGLTSSFEHKSLYAEVDLSLDTWPQTAGVSACDALWMGVPAVTLIGPRVIQRTTASLLTNLGLSQFITETKEDYINQAVSWVTERKSELHDIRVNLRKAFIASPIHAGYTQAVETAYRDLWREWCAQPMAIADAAYRLEQAS